MDNKVYVESKSGKILMPMNSRNKASCLVRKGLAKILSHKPLKIKLLYDTTGFVQKCTLGFDTGVNTASISVCSNNEIVYSDELELRTEQVRNNMEVKAINKASRNRNNRQQRIRQAKSNKTYYKAAKNVRFGTAKDTRCVKYIKNQKVRFDNRKHDKLSPTIRHLVDTHINHIKFVMRFLPISEIITEYTKFDIQKMENPDIGGIEYQNGVLAGYDSDFDYINDIQGGKCLFCNNKITQVHHRKAKSEGGSERIVNKAGVCDKHHDLLHKNPELYKSLIRKVKDYKKTSWLNIAMPYIYEKMKAEFKDIKLFKTYGNKTFQKRQTLGISKEHYNDSSCIAVKDSVTATMPSSENILKLKQFRRHNRAVRYAVNERYYYRENTKVAVNRHKREHQGNIPSLEEYRKDIEKLYGKNGARRIIGKLIVIPSKAKYREKPMYQPGDVVLYNNQRYVFRANAACNGKYVFLYGMTNINISVKKIRVLCKNSGIVCL